MATSTIEARHNEVCERLDFLFGLQDIGELTGDQALELQKLLGEQEVLVHQLPPI